jgi:hypothetical protein
MQVQKDQNENPFFFWERCNDHTDCSMKAYYLEESTDLYKSGFSSREIIGKYSPYLTLKVNIIEIDPILEKIGTYLSKSEIFYQIREYKLTVQDIELFQQGLQEAYTQLNETNILVIDLKERFPNAPEHLLATREMKIDSYIRRYYRLSDDLKHILKYRTMIFK